MADLLDDLEQLAAKATTGPWTHNAFCIDLDDGVATPTWLAEFGARQDAAFTAALVNAFPRLAAELRAARAALEWERGKVQTWRRTAEAKESEAEGLRAENAKLRRVVEAARVEVEELGSRQGLEYLREALRALDESENGR